MTVRNFQLPSPSKLSARCEVPIVPMGLRTSYTPHLEDLEGYLEGDLEG